MPKRILWIEDDEYYIDELVDFLRRENKVVIANTNQKWQTELDKPKGEYDLVILDIKFFDKNETYAQGRNKGEEILPLITAKWENTPVLVYTAKHDSREKMLNLGADDYIEKPVDLDQFRKSVYKLLNIETRAGKR